jgi:hypothetical protein
LNFACQRRDHYVAFSFSRGLSPRRQFVIDAKGTDRRSRSGQSSANWKGNWVETRRIHVGEGYCGSNHPQRFRVWIIPRVYRVTAAIPTADTLETGFPAGDRQRAGMGGSIFGGDYRNRGQQHVTVNGERS